MINIISLALLTSSIGVYKGPLSQPSTTLVPYDKSSIGDWTDVGLEVYLNNDDNPLSVISYFPSTTQVKADASGLTFTYSSNGVIYNIGSLYMSDIFTFVLDFNDNYLINYNCVVHLQAFHSQGSSMRGGVYHLWDSTNNQDSYEITTSGGTFISPTTFYLTLEFIEQDSTLVNAYDNRDADIQSAFDNGKLQGKLDYIDSPEYADEIQDAYDNGRQVGSSTGYAEGFADGQSQDSQIATIFNGVLNIALLPINVFLGMMNFEVFGINVGGFVSGLLTVAVIFILFRTIFNGGSKDDS